ncbi:MAG: HAD family phosphatase [Veillonella sp.]|uniref:Cof-type HAD-IIB family hydrolase n=1 Tax=Veillonella sp. TaxID=1926307 RepID=UPI0025FDA62E|nr:Cof-type HAD-IIB family hydrolase [Veillonella sp.]MBS4913348.1 HAD family phosphatase [Veillonella sp.]
MTTDSKTFDKAFLKKPVKLIVSDVDGTLVNKDKYVTPATVAAVHKAMDLGVTVAVASGRAWGEMAEVKRKIPEIKHYICSNGAVVMKRTSDDDAEVVFHESFSTEEGLALIDMLLPFNVYIEAYSGAKIYGDGEEMKEFASKISPHLLPLIKASRVMVDSLRDYIATEGLALEKVQLFYGDDSKKQEILDYMKGRTNFTIIESSEGNLEFVKPDISKGRAVAALAESMGLEPDEVMCIGDSNNDLTMLRYTPVSFAMGNGEETAKAAARYVAETNEEDGVAKAIEQVLQVR